MSANSGNRSAQKGARGEERARSPGKKPDRAPKPANIAPDAVKDPNEKTSGKPGLPPGYDRREGEVDPGGG